MDDLIYWLMTVFGTAYTTDFLTVIYLDKRDKRRRVYLIKNNCSSKFKKKKEYKIPSFLS